MRDFFYWFTMDLWPRTIMFVIALVAILLSAFVGIPILDWWGLLP